MNKIKTAPRRDFRKNSQAEDKSSPEPDKAKVEEAKEKKQEPEEMTEKPDLAQEFQKKATPRSQAPVALPASPVTKKKGEKKALRHEKILFRSLLGALLVVVVIGLCSWRAYESGMAAGIRKGEDKVRQEALRDDVVLTEETTAALEKAMQQLRRGEAESALEGFQALEKERLSLAGLSYLVALAAVQAGEIDLAETKARESINRLERVSDAYALLAVLETQKASDPSRPKMGNPRLRAESLLRQAVVADVANPYPRYELATILRYTGRNEEAAKELEAARLRLNPIDSHLVVGVTQRLMKLAAISDENLPSSSQANSPEELFPAAYVAMRQGNFTVAAALLRKSQGMLTPDIFHYLIYDPVFRKYSSQPELGEFFAD